MRCHCPKCAPVELRGPIAGNAFPPFAGTRPCEPLSAIEKLEALIFKIATARYAGLIPGVTFERAMMAIADDHREALATYPALLFIWRKALGEGRERESEKHLRVVKDAFMMLKNPGARRG